MGLNYGPLDLQSNALPLSYIPTRLLSLVDEWFYFSVFLNAYFRITLVTGYRITQGSFNFAKK